MVSDGLLEEGDDLVKLLNEFDGVSAQYEACLLVEHETFIEALDGGEGLLRGEQVAWFGDIQPVNRLEVIEQFGVVVAIELLGYLGCNVGTNFVHCGHCVLILVWGMVGLCVGSVNKRG